MAGPTNNVGEGQPPYFSSTFELLFIVQKIKQDTRTVLGEAGWVGVWSPCPTSLGGLPSYLKSAP